MKKKFKISLNYIFLIILGIVMIYPLIFLFFACFKTNEEIFGSIALLPRTFSFNAFVNGWKGNGQFSFTNFYVNTIQLVVPTVAFTILSSIVVAYGFARFEFPFKKILFSIMISTLMLPNAIIIIPRYIMFKNFNWINTYYPFIVPALFACYPFFIFMMVQFFRGLPRELDESAYLDGCNSFTVLIRILLPLCKPAIFAAGIFQFIWTWNDFFNTLVYINSVSKFPLSLALKMSLDNQSQISWNQIMAMALASIAPLILLFFLAQKYFVEGIATTGLKG